MIARSIDDRILGKNPNNSINKFIDYKENGQNGIFLPNTIFWAVDINTSCASMWNNAQHDLWGGKCDGWNMAGTLISARHVIYAHHYAIPHGTKLYFIDTTNSIYLHTLINSQSVSCDIRVGLLDSDLPSNIHPVKLLPPNYIDYIGTARGIPCITFDQEEKLVVSELSGLKGFNTRTSLSSAQRPYSNIRQMYYEDMTSGDSGNPRFLLINQELTLLYVMWKGGGGSGCFITHFINEIQACMNTLMSGYQLQFTDLDIFQRLPEDILAEGMLR